MEMRRHPKLSLRGRLLLPAFAAVAVLGGSFEATAGQESVSSLASSMPVLAQQIVQAPAGSLAFVVTEQTVVSDGIEIPGDGPGFLFGTIGSALVTPREAGSAVLLEPGEAASIAAGTRYQVEATEGATLLAIELQANRPDTSQAVSVPFSDIAGLRDMELRRAELTQQAQIVIEAESGIGVLVVAAGTALVEDANGAPVLAGAGEILELDESTPVTGIDPATVVLAVTLSDELGSATGEAIESDSPSNPTGSSNADDGGNTIPTVRTDSDGDGLYDDEEAAIGSDPNKVDTDQDGLSDGDEAHVYGSSPTSNDTDGDMLPDYNEITQQGTDPANPDTDGDGLSDHDELSYEGANPTMYDSDGDGLSDGEEAIYGSSSETPDYDGDGLSDFDEIKVYGSDPSRLDSDGDGVWDYNEVTDFKTNPANSDTDGDGFSDGFEINDGSDPLDANSPAS